MSDSFLIFDLISVYFSLNSCTTCGPCVALVGLVDLVGRELCPLCASGPKDDREINKMAVGAASTIAVCDRRKANGINRFHIVPPPPLLPPLFLALTLADLITHSPRQQVGEGERVGKRVGRGGGRTLCLV